MNNTQIPFFASPYKLSMFLECPRKYWYYYINEETKYKQPQYPYFTMGEHVHNALKNFFRLNPDLRTREKLLNLLTTFWGTKCAAEGGFESVDHEEGYKKRAVKMLENFYDKEDIKAEPIIWFSSSNPKVEVKPLLLFTGVFDRIDHLSSEALHVIDYKTGKEDAVDDNNLQLPMYALMADKIYRLPVKKVSYLNLASGNWNTKDLDGGYKLDIIAKVDGIVSKIPKNLDMGAFVCKYGNRCYHCDYLEDLGFNLDWRL